MTSVFKDRSSPCRVCKYFNYIYFCYITQCRFYCGGDFNSLIYKSLVEPYYIHRIEIDTEYARTDIDFTLQEDRAWIKILHIEETIDGYSGQYMYNHIFSKMLRTDKIIDHESAENIKRCIRSQYNYSITKREFRSVCRDAREDFFRRGSDDDYIDSSIGSLESVYA